MKKLDLMGKIFTIILFVWINVISILTYCTKGFSVLALVLQILISIILGIEIGFLLVKKYPSLIE